MNKSIYNLFLICCLATLFTNPVRSQVLDFLNKVSIPLDDGNVITLFGRTNPMQKTFSSEYYYLPTNLRLSRKRNNIPEFLFMKYTSEERSDAGGVNGALMHFLMEWGLTPEQEEELQSKLEAKITQLRGANESFASITKPRVMGAAQVRPGGENSFQIISSVLRDAQNTPTLVTSGRAPVIPGGKVAVAANLQKQGAQLMAATFEENRSISDVSISLLFEYDVMMPATEGLITVNWLKVDSVYQKYNRTATNVDGGQKGRGDNTVTNTEVSTLFSEMRSSKAVVVELDVLQPESQIAQDMVNAFMEYFLRSVSEKEFKAPQGDDQDDSRADQRDYNYAYNSYVIDRERLELKTQRRTETYSLKVRLPITQEFTLTRNMGEYYDQVRDNENCINTINLNDPFFQHRDIYLILDLDAEEMFGDQLNYVTVDIRKRRGNGNDFSKQVTFDKKFFEENGNRTVITYSKAQDEDPGAFEYKSQWSLKGGHVFSADTAWTQGSWEGITLAPPVEPQRIRFETDLEDLNELDIKNVSLQLRYFKFGKEVQSSFNITTSQGVGYMEKNIFMDRDTDGYAYRLIFFHKNKGQLATEWDAKLNTGYMYAVIPEQLRNNDPTFIQQMADEGKNAMRTKDGREVVKGVLDQFKDLIKKN